MGNRSETKESLVDQGGQELKLFDVEGSPVIGVEINLELIPLFLSKTRGRTEGSLEARNVIRTPEGQRLEQYVKVVAGREYGMPGPIDRDVYVSVMKLVHRKGGMPTDGRLKFTIYEILAVLGKKKGGTSYERVRDCLDRISDSVIYAENAFYDNETKQFRTHRFSPWSVHFASTHQGQGQSSERHLLVFDPILVHSYNSGYLKSLDTDFFFSLGNPMAKSLYQLVDAKRRGKLSWIIDVQQLRQLLSMPSSYKQDSKIEEKTRSGIRELKERGFLERADYERRGENHVLCFRVRRDFTELRQRPQVSLSPGEKRTAQALIAHDVASATAESLVSENGSAHCQSYLEALPYQSGITNPAGWLIKYIDNAWPVTQPPKSSPKRDQGSASQDATPESNMESVPRDQEPSSASYSPTRPSSVVQSFPVEYVQSKVDRRTEAGEFDEIISYLESLSFSDYSRFVETPSAVVDEDENRFYLAKTGELYVYVGDPLPNKCFYVATLNRQ
jgi:hypothetical protein